VSPNLLEARDLELAVPGTYEAHTDEVVKIASFAPSLSVIMSKQRPRKLSMFGSDGKEYTFLLKGTCAVVRVRSRVCGRACAVVRVRCVSFADTGAGHEDLRQDERVMQLFGLINTLLANDRETANRHLSIQRYAIIPLSPNSGLIGWVPNHDTLHALIKDYRESRKILINLELKLMVQMANASTCDALSLIQKVHHTTAHTTAHGTRHTTHTRPHTRVQMGECM
jgi:FKBP12-rapamycin complex-associated protein